MTAGCCAGGPGRGATGDTGEVNRQPGKDAQLFVEVVAGRGIKLHHLVGGVQRALKSLDFSEPLVCVGGRRRLSSERQTRDQRREEKDKLKRTTLHHYLLLCCYTFASIR